jgi:hypothetical protein
LIIFLPDWSVKAKSLLSYSRQQAWDSNSGFLSAQRRRHVRHVMMVVMAMGQRRHIEITGYGDPARFVKTNLAPA